MALIQLRDVYKAFVEQEVLRGVSFQVHKGERVGLVGPNGAGKSTIFKIILGMEELDLGEVTKDSKATFGYLAQDFEWEADTTLFHGMLEVFKGVFAIGDRLRELEVEMGKPEVLADEQLYAKVMDEYSDLSHRYDELDGYSIESRIKGILKGLGFEEKDYSLKISQLSGGQKTRAGLGRMLLIAPDLLLLDEPTNHLDLMAQEWLENYLKDYPGAMLIISHDRYFLDQVVTRLLDLREGEIDSYPGNYSFYIVERQRRLLEWQREYEKQQEKIADTEEYIRRNIAGVNTRQAQGRRKLLERMDRIMRPPMEPDTPKINFTFKGRSGDDVLRVQDLTKTYPGVTLFKDITINLFRGDKVGIVGPNGAGKTTFLKVILGQLKPDAGKATIGASVQLSYYSQEHESLDPNVTLLDHFCDKYHLLLQEARDLLGKFLFSEDDVFKNIGSLSGGERSRLVLAELSLEKGNFLILDEPTNHLDIFSTEVLEEALVNFPGTVLMVSHDRFFMERITNKIWEISDGNIREYTGTYSDYKKKKEEQAKIVEISKVSELKEEFQKLKKERNEEQSLKRRIDELEKEIHRLEESKVTLMQMLSDPTFYQRSQAEFLRKNEEYQKTCEKLDQLYRDWETLVS